MPRDPMYAMEKQLPLRVLSADDWRHWKTWGYVRVPHAVPLEKIERLKRTLWEFTGMDPDDRETWSGTRPDDHPLPEVNHSGMVEIYQHQHLWDIREEPRIYDTFVDIWDREDLWVALDRANVNPPNKGDRAFDGFIHWDIDTSLDPLPFEVQGVVSLVDTGPEIGGTQAYPRLYRDFSAWAARQPADRDPWKPDTTGLGEPELLPTNAGDLLVFNSLLPHGVRPNTTEDRVRMAQYVTMFPAEEQDAEQVKHRLTVWRDRTPPKPVFPGDPRGREREYPPPVLSEFGEKLLGARSWATGERVG
ncbi:phytanoyl-CoA dioxygenase family protein [Streptomyces albiaxialis]